jgi:uncharacterized protein
VGVSPPAGPPPRRGGHHGGPPAPARIPAGVGGRPYPAVVDSVTLHPARLRLEDQIRLLREALATNPVLIEVLRRAAEFALPGWYLTAGCVIQTVWNAMTGRAPTTGIKDYDLFCFDDSDLSWDAEDAVIQRGNQVFAGVGADVEIRNQARVHLWYPQRFGIPCPAYTSTEAAIDSFPVSTCCVGVHLDPDTGRWLTYAPHGLSDVFGLVLRPNLTGIATGGVYSSKTARWLRVWPELRVIPWPDGR